MLKDDLSNLIDDWLLGEADAAARARLEETLRSDPAARRQLFDRLLLDAHLYRAHAVPAVPVRPLILQSPWRWYAAAAILVIGLLAAFYASRPDPAPQAPGYALTSGEITVNGSPSQAVKPGDKVVVTGTTTAVLSLPDGSRAHLEPRARLTVRGPASDARQVLDLESGTGRFTVTPGQGQFRVATPVGSVAVVGTDFTVRLQNKDRATLTVSVAEGKVRVSSGGEDVLLAAGQSRSFGHREAGRTGEPAAVTGTIIKAEGRLLTLASKGDSGAKETAIAVSDKATILVELDEMIATPGKEGGKQRKTIVGTLADLKVGARIAATLENGTAVSVTVKYVPAPKKGTQ